MKSTRKFTKTNFFQLCILFVFIGILLLFSVPEGCLFGSETDWFCQHVALADYMRRHFYATSEWLPDFSGLGGGSNFYNISYYGLLRPDVVLSYFLPEISMANIIQGYAVLEIFAGAGLLYFWLWRKGIRGHSCFISGMLYSCANCLFQAHRQIMFVDYLPFLILSLMAIDSMIEKLAKEQNRMLHSGFFHPQKRRSRLAFPYAGLTVSLFLILLHSFYFFPACFAACTLYFFFEMRNTGRDQKLTDGNYKLKKGAFSFLKKEFFSSRTGHAWIKYLLSAATSVCLFMAILLPTGLAILENKKDVKAVDFSQLLSFNPSLNSLLYSTYGCGLTILCLYTLLLSIRRKKTRVFASLLFSFLFFHVFYWILNGTLYIRPKSLIPFVPLLLLLTAQTLDELKDNTTRHSIPAALLCQIPVWIQADMSSTRTASLMVIDGGILLCYAVAGSILQNQRGSLQRFPCKRNAFKRDSFMRSSLFSAGSAAQAPQIAFRFAHVLLLCTLPALLFLAKARTETFVPASTASREVFSTREISQLYKNRNYRLDVLESPTTHANAAITGKQQKSTLYSSVSNSNYNHVFYDILKMPVSIRNRVSVNADANPFQEYLMGVRYICTTKDKLPAGYTPLLERDGQVIAQNDQVLPLAYGSSALLDEKQFNALSYPQNLDTLMNRTIVSDAGSSSLFAQNTASGKATLADKKARNCYQPYKSQMEEYELPEDLFKRGDSTREFTVTRALPRTVRDEILLLSFDVEYAGKKDVSITINGIRNRLSGSDAAYPNHNTTFTYMISSEKPLDTLKLEFSPGDYRLHNLKAYTLPLRALSHPGITPFTFRKTEGKELLNGTISMEQDGYFVTSFAFSNGYHILLDGKKVSPERVNKAFVGFPLKKGTHEIVLTFHAPGKTAGSLISLLALCYFLVGCIQPLLSASRHQNRILHRVRVVTFTDTVTVKSHALIQPKSRLVTAAHFKMNNADSLLIGKAYEAFHKKVPDPLTLPVPADRHIGDVALVQHRKKPAIPKNHSLFFHYKKHGVPPGKKRKITLPGPGNGK